jgi:hypothetical protein
METKLAVQTLSALAQESRLAIFRLLVKALPRARSAKSWAYRLPRFPSILPD